MYVRRSFRSAHGWKSPHLRYALAGVFCNIGRFIFLRSIINHSFISNFGSSERYVVLIHFIQVKKSTVNYPILTQVNVKKNGGHNISLRPATITVQYNDVCVNVVAYAAVACFLRVVVAMAVAAQY